MYTQTLYTYITSIYVYVTDLSTEAVFISREVLFSTRACKWYGRLLRKFLHEIDVFDGWFCLFRVDI